MSLRHYALPQANFIFDSTVFTDPFKDSNLVVCDLFGQLIPTGNRLDILQNYDLLRRITHENIDTYRSHECSTRII